MDKLHLVIVGHVDHGKSSLIGRILYETGVIPRDKLESVKTDHGHIEFSHLLDHLKEEREQEITIETTRTYFHYLDREFVIIDAPGHVEFTKNMVTGASAADAAVLIVDASEGIREQTVRHSYLLSLLGIKDIIVVINKMDKVDYSRDIYQDICQEITELLNSLGINASYFVPTSVTDGANIYKNSEKTKWYKSDPLIHLLYQMRHRNNEDQKQIIFPLQDVTMINGKRLAIGRLESGNLSVGDRIYIYPGKRSTVVKSIEKFGDKNIQKACEGECIGITTSDPVFLERGNMICSCTGEQEDGDGLLTSIFWMNPVKLCAGEEITVRCLTQEVKGIVKEIRKVINTRTLEIEKEGEELENLYAGEIEISLFKPLCMSCYGKNKKLGRVVFLKNKQICGGGIIKRVGKRNV